jgi:multiple sugar transport system permease protein
MSTDAIRPPGRTAAAARRAAAHRPRRSGHLILKIVVNLVFLAAAMVAIGPLLWMVATSLKPENQALNDKFFAGYPLTWSNYSNALTFFPFIRYFLNDLFVSLAGTAMVILTSAMAGFAFARIRFRGRDRLFWLYVASLLIPGEVLIVPLFLLVKGLGMYNSYGALILPFGFSAYGVFLMRQFFRTLPQELVEAGRLEGASFLRIFGQIMLPLVKPAAAVLGVFTFIQYWNSFLWVLVATQGNQVATIPLGLSLFQTEYGTYWSYLMAAATLTALPAGVAIVFVQRYVARGVVFGGLGGR